MGLLSRFFKSKDKEDLGEAPPTVLPLRNEPCWCGSGLKYKKCHLEADQVYLEKMRLKKLAASKSCSPTFG
jgi:hypothetical protein